MFISADVVLNPFHHTTLFVNNLCFNPLHLLALLSKHYATHALNFKFSTTFLFLVTN